MIYVHPVFLMAIPSLLITIFSLVYLCGNKAVRNSIVNSWKTTLTCTIMPGLLFLLIFFSLALHMHSSLGQWPESLGNHGFSHALNVHAEVASNYFSCFLLFAIFIWPVLVASFAIIARLKNYLPQIMALGLSFWVFVPWIFLAPSDFLNWWWD